MLRVAGDFTRKFDSVNAAYDQRVRLHWVRTGERWAAAAQQRSLLKKALGRMHTFAEDFRVLDRGYM